MNTSNSNHVQSSTSAAVRPGNSLVANITERIAMNKFTNASRAIGVSPVFIPLNR